MKDTWDKVEILAKLCGAVFVPAAVAASVYLWNAERSKLQAQATMTGIAVTVLTTDFDDSELKVEPLRDWAIAVLQSPENPPALDDEAAKSLRGLSTSQALAVGAILGYSMKALLTGIDFSTVIAK